MSDVLYKYYDIPNRKTCFCLFVCFVSHTFQCSRLFLTCIQLSFLAYLGTIWDLRNRSCVGTCKASALTIKLSLWPQEEDIVKYFSIKEVNNFFRLAYWEDLGSRFHNNIFPNRKPKHSKSLNFIHVLKYRLA